MVDQVQQRVVVRDTWSPHCGVFRVRQNGHQRCDACGQMTWRNPLPVAVIVLPAHERRPDGSVNTGVVVVDRAVEPYGPALPGGFIEEGETWQQAAVRELFEETGARVDDAAVELIDVRSSDHLLVFCHACVDPMMFDIASLRPAHGETNTVQLVGWGDAATVELVFPLHTRALRRYLRRTGRR